MHTRIPHHVEHAYGHCMDWFATFICDMGAKGSTLGEILYTFAETTASILKSRNQKPAEISNHILW